ncbi:PREDICTED: tetraspanin-5-like [Polistes canadensis]|uniref:tetraspanin-5-like n=1 Tax=Polistes canadensis TaxID=91411 RepID=UPI000718DE3B|nr:PREDICTED: tetraspanin-5-like [Polistes canadensis]
MVWDHGKPLLNVVTRGLVECNDGNSGILCDQSKHLEFEPPLCTVTFIIGFTGCVGALRENTCLLAAYAIFLALLLLMEMTAGVLGFIFKDWLQCCGIEGPKDWDRNNYFNCSSSDIGSREACGVPFSCCKRKPNEIIKNKQCGYDVRKPSYNFEVAKVIYEKGCVQAGEEWMERNLLPIASGAVVTAFAQILGICFAQNLRADIFAQKAKWH